MNITPACILTNLKKEIERTNSVIEDGEGFYWFVASSCFCRNYKIKVESGCTRGVIIPPNENYIIKFDIDWKDHFCEVEALNYRKAKRAGLEKFFAAMRFLVRFNFGGFRMDFYIQEKVDEMMVDNNSIYRSDYDCSEDYEAALEEGEASESNEDCVPYGWADRVIDYFGSNTYYRIIDFLNDNDINDVHSGNVGFMGDRCVIFDFAGY